MTHDNPSRFTDADYDVIQTIGSMLQRIIHDEKPQPVVSERRDELGILVNMVNRVSKEFYKSRRRDEKQRAELEQRLIELRESQEEQRRLMYTIEELSTPILNIYRSVLLLPIVGGVDPARAQKMLGMLLDRVTASRASVVILDITGLPVLDTQVANTLVQAAQAASLLGAQVILCGMTPDVAQVVVSLGIDLAMFRPCSDLQAALQLALAMTRHKIVPA
ncbi:MAG TPA: STAS domain-containing protein [Herpetosiphonaceae bacterium]|nr:STAS domain-containing protein [Herpetosiphonaceae bacterium]